MHLYLFIFVLQFEDYIFKIRRLWWQIFFSLRYNFTGLGLQTGYKLGLKTGHESLVTVYVCLIQHSFILWCYIGAYQVLTVAANSSRPLPLAYMFSQMWFRPAGDEMLTYTDVPVKYQTNKLKAGESKSTPLTCNSVLDSRQSYRWAAMVKIMYSTLLSSKVL